MTKMLGVPLAVWGGLCLVLTGVWVFVWPRQAALAGVRFIIVRWFHALTWLLLAVAAFVAGFDILGGVQTAKPIAFLSLLVYLVFIGTLSLGRLTR